MQLHLTLDNHPLDLIEHGFDVGVRSGPVRDSSYHVRRLSQQALFLMASPAYLDRAGRPTHPRELETHDLIAVRETPGPLSWELDGPDGPFSMKITPNLVTNDPIMALRQGVSGARIETLSYGKERPIDGGSSEDAWAKNRNARTAITDGAR
ncbi:MAG: hypothetical protein B7Z45_07265 [Azorhizobium sp. 12-66-6]|nr:MAG: hypothetical protein B7Z45_07265 [Azorhizobium sp. 12-66-6]